MMGTFIGNVGRLSARSHTIPPITHATIPPNLHLLPRTTPFFQSPLQLVMLVDVSPLLIVTSLVIVLVVIFLSRLIVDCDTWHCDTTPTMGRVRCCCGSSHVGVQTCRETKNRHRPISAYCCVVRRSKRSVAWQPETSHIVVYFVSHTSHPHV